MVLFFNMFVTCQVCVSSWSFNIDAEQYFSTKSKFSPGDQDVRLCDRHLPHVLVPLPRLLCLLLPQPRGGIAYLIWLFICVCHLVCYRQPSSSWFPYLPLCLLQSQPGGGAVFLINRIAFQFVLLLFSCNVRLPLCWSFPCLIYICYHQCQCFVFRHIQSRQGLRCCRKLSPICQQNCDAS